MQQRITLKSVKVAQFASEETLCFQASVYLDGKRVAVASNDGRGGMTDINDPKGGRASDATVEALYKAAREQFPEHAADWDESQSNPKYQPSQYSLIEWAIDDLVYEADLIKDIKRSAKKGLVYRLPEDGRGGLRVVSGGRDDEARRAYLLREEPTALLRTVVDGAVVDTPVRPKPVLVETTGLLMSASEVAAAQAAGACTHENVKHEMFPSARGGMQDAYTCNDCGEVVQVG